MIRLPAIREAGEMGLDLLDRNWRDPPAIDADVTALGVADQVAVAVAVEVDRAVVRVARHSRIA